MEPNARTKETEPSSSDGILVILCWLLILMNLVWWV
ncbi:hypothetical protein VP5_gp23 [Vibrio phage VP5]|nr:hypothetical protein VP5_gp23 [Vibrio phage VP5]